MAQEAPLAVVGLACRFPGAPDADAFWANVLGDVCAIRPMSPERFHRARYFDPEVGAYGKTYGGPGTITSALASRIASSFGLTGRHMVVDAACASSFAALDIGARALRQGRLDMALVGGASYSQEMSVVLFAQSRALSPDGSFPF